MLLKVERKRFLCIFEKRDLQRAVDDKISLLESIHEITNSSGLPASLSREMITEKLRGELRFQRVILTDSLSAQAITDTYSAGQAALLAFQAGADLLLMPEDLPEAYDALLSAVEKGTISQERLDQSVLRMLQLKEKYDLM